MVCFFIFNLQETWERGITMFEKCLNGISGLDEAVMEEANRRSDLKAIPRGSLGKLEDMAIQIAGMTKEIHNHIHKKCTVVMSADNGIFEEGIASTPQHITALQTVNMVKGTAAIAVLSKQAGADLKVVDIGIKGDINCPGLINRKISHGTRNFLKSPAMTREETIRAIEIGIQVIGDLKKDGYGLVGTGEMGIANTTTSTAILMAFTGMDAEEVVGRGAGLTDAGFQKKKRVIKEGLRLHKPDKNDPIDVLSKVGGLDIAGLVGCFLGAAYYRIPVVVDGVISAAAAYVAYKLAPLCKEFMIPSHRSTEPAYIAIMDELGLDPILNMNMRLGEGTGCPLAFHMVESALAIMNDMVTFDDISQSSDYLEGLEYDA